MGRRPRRKRSLGDSPIDVRPSQACQTVRCSATISGRVCPAGRGRPNKRLAQGHVRTKPKGCIPSPVKGDDPREGLRPHAVTGHAPQPTSNNRTPKHVTARSSSNSSGGFSSSGSRQARRGGRRWRSRRKTAKGRLRDGRPTGRGPRYRGSLGDSPIDARCQQSPGTSTKGARRWPQ